MKLLGRVSAFVPVLMIISMCVGLMSHAEIQDLSQKQNDAVKQLRKYARTLKPRAEFIVERASDYAPEPVYQAKVWQYPKRRSNAHKYKSDFITLEFQSEDVTTNMLCLKSNMQNYWCQVKPEIEGADIRQLRSYKKFDLERLVAIAFYNKNNVREMSAEKIAKLAPNLAKQLWMIEAEKKRNVNAQDLVFMYDAHVYSLGALKNPFDSFLFEKSVNLQPFIDAKKIRDRSFFGRDDFAALLRQI